jgi:hypothetical protein
MNQLVEVERVDLASVHLRETIAYVVEEETQLLLVILADHLTRRATTRLFVLDISDPNTFGHTRNLPRPPVCAHQIWARFPAVFVARPAVGVKQRLDRLTQVPSRLDALSEQ